ncbi:MAG: recombinase RecA [Thermoproteota archaeon]|nr:MAG: recombinase RecA [Candidatus Korarchaeota archaeon]
MAKRKAEVKTDNLDIIKKAITKKYGNVISKLSDHEDMVIPTVSTGSISLDVALGRGGMAIGRLYEVFGPNSGGKSTLAANVVIQGQKRGMNCCYVDAEHAVDPLLFKSYGVDIKALDLIQGYNGEENLDILEMLVSSGAYKIAVVDSVSSLIPSNEAASEIGDDHIALLARLMSKATRRLTPIANRAGCLIIFINQLRMKVGGYGNPEVTTGGEALAFYTTGRISVRGPEAKARRIPDPLTGEVIGHTTLFEIVKNKLAPPFKKTEINLIYGKGYDTHWEVLKLGVDLGIIDKSGAWYSYNDSNFAQGEPNAAAYLKSDDNSTMYNEIRAKVIDMVGLTEIYEQNS